MKMKKILRVSLVSMMVFLFFTSCTMGGAEIGLLGTWNLTSFTSTSSSGTSQSATDTSGTLVITGDDHFKMNIKFTISNMEFTVKNSGKLTASNSAKTLTFDFYGVDDDVEYDYVLNSAILTLEQTTSSGAKNEYIYTKQFP